MGLGQEPSRAPAKRSTVRKARISETVARDCTNPTSEDYFMKRDLKQEALELRKQRAAIVEEMNDLTEPTKWNTEAQQRYKKLDGQQVQLKDQIDAIERQ